MRRGYTLLELLTVITIIGLLAGLSARFLPDSLGNLGSRVEGRRLARDLRQTRTRAIATGDNHRLTFIKNGSVITGYTIYRVLGDGSTSAVDTLHELSTAVGISSNGDYVEFDFEGSASGADLLILAGPNRSMQVTLATLTGTITVTEL